jgi:hypothetical protein
MPFMDKSCRKRESDSSVQMKMRREIAQYIISLDQSANKTHHAEDRQTYRVLLADSAVLLALVDTAADQED